MTTKKANAKKDQFDYQTIKSFEDACKRLGIDFEHLPYLSKVPEEFHKPILAYYKLVIIFKAINNGWKPNWGNYNEYKYYPWYYVLSSGFGFDDSYYNCTTTGTTVGSRLCTDTSEKAIYIAKQFEDLYKDYILYSE